MLHVSLDSCKITDKQQRDLHILRGGFMRCLRALIRKHMVRSKAETCLPAWFGDSSGNSHGAATRNAPPFDGDSLPPEAHISGTAEAIPLSARRGASAPKPGGAKTQAVVQPARPAEARGSRGACGSATMTPPEEGRQGNAADDGQGGAADKNKKRRDKAREDKDMDAAKKKQKMEAMRVKRSQDRGNRYGTSLRNVRVRANTHTPSPTLHLMQHVVPSLTIEMRMNRGVCVACYKITSD